MAIADSVLENSELEVIGRLVDASNASLLCQLSDGSKAIYKPIAGERPLWDFPDGNLASREVAAYYISEVGKFNLVPKTILREGPFGLGAVQQWIEIAEELDVVEFAQGKNPELRKMALFDVLVNNSDRKFGHILPSSSETIYGCDHGVTFHIENKLRTVIWQFAGSELTAAEILQIENLLTNLDENYLQNLLTDQEICALKDRGQELLRSKSFPLPNPNWPAIPWPPY